MIETNLCPNPEQLLNRLFEGLSTGAGDDSSDAPSRMPLPPASRPLPHARRAGAGGRDAGERDPNPSYRRAAGSTRHASLPRVVALDAAAGGSELELAGYAYAGGADLLGPDDPFLCEPALSIGASGDAGGSTQSLSGSGPIGGLCSASGSGNNSLNSTFTGGGPLPSVPTVRRTSSERMLAAHALPAIAPFAIDPMQNQHFYSTLHERVVSYI